MDPYSQQHQGGGFGLGGGYGQDGMYGHSQGGAGPSHRGHTHSFDTSAPGGAPGGADLAKEAGNLLGGSFSPLAKTAVAAYGEKAQQFVQNRMNFFSGPLTKNLQYYFNVNTNYVLKKMKLLLCPFIHKGSWTRMPEQVPGGFQFKPPRHDLNAPDLYIPAMAFNTYCVASSIISLSGTNGSAFGPEKFGNFVWSAFLIWLVEVLMLRTAVYLLSSPQAALGVPLFDLCCYGGYVFVHVTAQILIGFFAGHWGYYIALAWGTLCMGVFLVKTFKRILYSQTRQASKQNSKRQSYMLLAISLAQLPLAYWLGYIK
mmetsp:Transcript_7310/g.18024  ORF Transcript_7310/g.18024 Transcript_7310/m.18024 type:complete len:314 (+) Transcript_7310:227-1168(+)